MTNILWPSALPQVLRLDGLAGQKKNNVIRTQMDAGPQKQRRRYTIQSKYFEGSIICTEAQRQFLESWFDNTLGGGALRFTMKDPQTLLLSEFRFRETYREESVNGLWKITLPLEKLNA